MRGIVRGLRSETGQDAVEYVLLALLIGLAITVGMVMLATVQNRSFSNAAACVQLAGAGPGSGGGAGGPSAPGAAPNLCP